MDYLHIEWHPNAIPDDAHERNQLSEGLSLREALKLLLDGCPHPPRVVSHEGAQLPFQRYALGCPGGRKPA